MRRNGTLTDEAALNPLLERVADALRDGLVLINADSCITFANAEAGRILQREPEKIVGRSLDDLSAGSEESKLSNVISRLGPQGSETIGFRFASDDGGGIPVILSLTAIVSSEGTSCGAVALVRRAMDMSDADAVRSRLAAIVESSDDGIVSKNLDGIIQSWNKGAERIFGWSAEEAIGKSIMLIIPPDRQYEEVDIISRIRRGQRVDHFRTVRQRKDGSLIDVSVTISPVRNSRGEIVGASKVARDITEQTRANSKMQEELERLVMERTSELEKANKEMEGFTYSISHDLRGPLRSIVSSCMILREDFGPQLPAEAQAELDKQAKAAKKMADLIDDLLKLSRLGRQPLKKKDLDLSAVAREVAAEIMQGNRQCSFEIEEGMNAYADAATMRLLLSNLLENACKFSNQGGLVKVGKDNGVFFVRDEGIGFDQQYQEKIFLPFERLVLEREYPGTGIGLANVKRIIDRHGGQVWAESGGAGQGATFFFSLPPKEEEA